MLGLMLVSFGSDLDIGEVKGGIGGFGGSFSEWVASVREIWELVLEFGQGFPCFGWCFL